MNRWKAFAIHLSLSLVVFTCLLGIIVLAWYPGVLFRIDGGWAGLKLVMGVDVVLGPLLTLLVYRAGKRGLKFDLGCIVAAQVACMAAGIWIVYQSRPIALVFAYDTFYSLAADEFQSFGKDPAIVKDFPGSWPKLVYTELPESEFGVEVAYLRSQFIEEPLFMQTEKYLPFPDQDDNLFRRAATVRDEAAELVGEALIESAEDCLLSRFVSAHQSGFVCFDPESRRLTSFFPGQS